MKTMLLVRAAACRLGILAAGAALTMAVGASPAAAAMGPQCATGNNAATGQTIQVCAEWAGVAVNSFTVNAVLACAAVSAPASVSTQVSCYFHDTTTGTNYGASSASAPGSAAATESVTPLQPPVGPLQTCISGSAKDVSNNLVSLPLTCF
jgi:hypothetical protein